MRFLKTLIVIFLVTVGGTFVSYRGIRLIANDPMLTDAKFGDVFTGYAPHYKKGASLSQKAAEDWKAGYINKSIDEIVPWVLIALVLSLTAGGYAGFKVYSGTWLRGRNHQRLIGHR
jgi:hypothetical protein